jgi:aminoglycoside 6'-N-acetyltransferase I
MRAVWWPESSAEEHAQELGFILSGKFPAVMPLVIFVSTANNGTLTGFIEAGLPPCADGCEPSRTVGYVEGWYVLEGWRKQGIGAELLRAAEDRARSQGCLEMASDTAIDNLESQRAHETLGFKMV